MPNAIRIHTKEKIRAQAGIEPTTLGVLAHYSMNGEEIVLCSLRHSQFLTSFCLPLAPQFSVSSELVTLGWLWGVVFSQERPGSRNSRGRNPVRRFRLARIHDQSLTLTFSKIFFGIGLATNTGCFSPSSSSSPPFLC